MSEPAARRGVRGLALAAARATRAAWMLLGLVLVLLMTVELGLRAVFWVKDSRRPLEVPDRRVVDRAFGGAAWPAVHYQELERLRQEWSPYVYFRQGTFQGETIHVDASGQRWTWTPPPGSESARPKVLLLGGSSLWGFGARDDQTIPSHLVRRLHDQGHDIEVRNLAEIGHVNTQELIALARELQAGYRPDVVVFYDGVNDTTSALLEGEAGVTTNEGNRRREFNLSQSPRRMLGALLAVVLKDSASLRLARTLRQKFLGESAVAYPALAPMQIEELATQIVDRYRANLRMADALAREYRFRCLFVWQPAVFDKRHRDDFEEQESQRYSWARDLFRAVRERMRLQNLEDGRSNVTFQNLGQLFDGEPGLVFLDYCHTTESANATIARAIAEKLIPLLR